MGPARRPTPRYADSPVSAAESSAQALGLEQALVENQLVEAPWVDLAAVPDPARQFVERRVRHVQPPGGAEACRGVGEAAFACREQRQLEVRVPVRLSLECRGERGAPLSPP